MATADEPIQDREKDIDQDKLSSDRVENKSALERLYQSPIESTRSGKTFNAHSYPTKINPHAILPFILAHTRPGDLVFDGFSGSGSTGFATVLSEKQTSKPDLSRIFGSNIAWGPRECLLYDISTLATFVSDTIVNPPDPEEFRGAAIEIVKSLRKDWGWLYQAKDTTGGSGEIRYTVWTDNIGCTKCGNSFTFWSAAVKFDPPTILNHVQCPWCGTIMESSTAPRVIESYYDDLLHLRAERRNRSPAKVYGRSGTKCWKRDVDEEDIRLIERINDVAIPSNVPVIPMLNRSEKRWGELYRQGYHLGITHLHHFYTRRNLIALSTAFKLTERYPEDVRKALMLWISSYNSSHSTLMTRVVCKKKSKDLVVTSGQPGALYISSLPVEKNVFLGLSNKIGPVYEAFEEMWEHRGNVRVVCKSSLNVDLPDSSVDYIFTDPPFGDNIQYSEVNFIDEAWLGRLTEPKEEAIVSRFQGKAEKEYQNLMNLALHELNRILKPGHYTTLVFHSSKAKTWEALRQAIESSGFHIIQISTLDKSQGSFKQTTTKGFVKGDALILLKKGMTENCVTAQPIDPWVVTSERLAALSSINIQERTGHSLYNHLIKTYLQRDLPVPLDAKQFYVMLPKRFARKGDAYYIGVEGGAD